MEANYGYAGSILRVDLSSGDISRTPTSYYATRFLGGRGIGLKIYWDEVKPEIGAFHPENRVMFLNGPASGTSPGVSGSRWIICGKSPCTVPEQFSYCNLGGDWGRELKLAGYDGLVVHGKSDKPVYLFIKDDKVEIRDASHLWNRKTTEVRTTLKNELGQETKIASTGPAGDNMAVYAVVLADHDASGTNGFGAVMGSKKLKAIAVKGSGEVKVANPSQLASLNDYACKLTKAAPRQPSPNVIAAPEKRWDDPCPGCDIGCEREVYQAKDGTTSKFICEPAYWYAIRAKRYYEGKQDWSEVPFLATAFCNQYGVDVNALDSLVYWLTKCYRAGILTDENTGIPLSKEGSIEYIDTLLRKISYREGFGDTLALGLFKAADMVGNQASSLITDFILKAQQNAAYNPRFYILTAILYALEPRQPIQQLHEISSPFLRWVRWMDKGANAYVSTEVLLNITKRFLGSELAADFSTYEGKALAAVKIQDRVYAKESIILCDRAFPIRSTEFTDDYVGDPTIENRIVSAITGNEINEDGLYEIGERLFNLQRAIQVKEVGPQEKLPEYVFTIPQKRVFGNPNCHALKKEGNDWITWEKRNPLLNRNKFHAMMREFYGLRGWDEDSGLQTKKKLKEVGLNDIVDELAERNLVV